MPDIPPFLQPGVSPRYMLVSDLDHTMVQNEDPTHKYLLEFNRIWNGHFAHDSVLVYSTGRSPVLYRQLWEEAPLLTPQVLICSVGTEVFYLKDGTYQPDPAWNKHLDQGWNREEVLHYIAMFPELKAQAATEQRIHKLSYLLHAGSAEAATQLLSRLEGELAGAGLAAKIIYSGGVDVDIISTHAGKGRALEFILGQVKEAGCWPTQGVQVNGDSGNDVELFQVPGVQGCVVSNAHPELMSFAQKNPSPLIFMATLPCAGGIVEAMQSFSVIPPATSLPIPALLRLKAWEYATSSATATVDCSLASENNSNLETVPAAHDHIQAGEEAAAAGAHYSWIDQVELAEIDTAKEPAVWRITYKAFQLLASGKREVTTIKKHTVQVQVGVHSSDLTLVSKTPVQPSEVPLPPDTTVPSV